MPHIPKEHSECNLVSIIVVLVVILVVESAVDSSFDEENVITSEYSDSPSC